MNNKVIKLLFISLSIVFSHVQAAGKITGINFSGPDDPNHPNIIQIQIEGGYNSGDCNTQFAAIRDSADRKHLISFAIAAYATKEPVTIVVNNSDKYFQDRCTISRISSVY